MHKWCGKKEQAVRGTWMHNLSIVNKACDVWLKNKGLSNEGSSYWKGASNLGTENTRKCLMINDIGIPISHKKRSKG